MATMAESVGPMSEAILVRRAFADVSFGQVHYRWAGDGPPLLLCHASPGSAKQLERLIVRLARTFRVIAPDTPGNGDSSPLPITAPTIADFAQAQIEWLTALGLGQLDAYGTHTGASIISETALIEPGRLRRLVLNGAGAFAGEQRDEYLRLYAHPFSSDADGAYLLRAFGFCRDQYLFFPWYARDKAHRRDGGLPTDESLHHWVLEVLKARTSYHLGYRAAFAYPAAERIALISQPLLLMAAANDPLRGPTLNLSRTAGSGTYMDLPSSDDSGFLETLAGAIETFLTGSQGA